MVASQTRKLTPRRLLWTVPVLAGFCSAPVQVTTQAALGYFESSDDVGDPAIAGSTTYDAGTQTYTEDCAVCCRPIVVTIEVGDDDAIEGVMTRREQD